MLKLVIGNKNYSSWSMRPWLALRANGIPFEEVLIPLYTDNPADKQRILSFSDAGKVPALVDGDVTVWDSLSIIEYLAEKFPQARLWPEDRARRAHARSISAEMHSGFAALRTHWSMKAVGSAQVELPPAGKDDVARVQEIWADCHSRYGKEGPFLFGAFGAADAMFAPVVHRFRTYAIEVSGEARHYYEAMQALPAFREWTRDGLAETLLIERFETV